MGGDEVPDYADDEGESEVHGDGDGFRDVLGARIEEENMPIIGDVLAAYRREIQSEGPELQALMQMVSDTTDRVLTDKRLLAEWVTELRQHRALSLPLDMTQRDSILRFAKAIAVRAVMESRSEQLRTAIAAFTNRLNGTRFEASNAPRQQHSKNVLRRPARKRGRRSGK